MIYQKIISSKQWFDNSKNTNNLPDMINDDLKTFLEVMRFDYYSSNGKENVNRARASKMQEELFDKMPEEELEKNKTKFIYERNKIKKVNCTYIPFNYDFNFGIKELYICGLIEVYKRGDDIFLTEQGRIIDYNEFPNSKQLNLIDTYWNDKKQVRFEKNKNSKKNTIELDEIKDETIEAEESSDDWKSIILEKIKEFSPKKFENFSRLLLSRMGIRFDPIKGIQMSSDHGIDGYGYFESDEFRISKVVVQCKRFSDSPVSEPDIDKFKGVMMSFNADYGIFITTSYFTKQAQEKAVQGSSAVTLIDGQRLVELIEKYKLYVTPVQTYILDDYYYQKD